MSREVRHPLFARVYANLTGRVIELGAGNGYEHVRPNNPRTAALFQRLDDRSIWPRLAGGCHPARDTEATIRNAGFAVEQGRRFPFEGGPVSAPHILGTARRR